MVVNVSRDSLEYVGIGDCSLLVKSNSGMRRIRSARTTPATNESRRHSRESIQNRLKQLLGAAREQLWPKRLARTAR